MDREKLQTMAKAHEREGSRHGEGPVGKGKLEEGQSSQEAGVDHLVQTQETTRLSSSRLTLAFPRPPPPGSRERHHLPHLGRLGFLPRKI